MISHWILAARIKTLPVSICPVLLAVSLSLSHPSYSTLTTICIVLCVLFIQIGTNFANDYFDFIKGADTNERVGPKRMTQSGRISPNIMKNASIVVFTLAFLLGLYLVYVGGWPILLIGLLSIFFGVIYTAGPFPLAYVGGAEVVSYLFFGPVSVIGTYYLQTLTWNFDLFIIGSGIGLITSALLVVNNTRDIDSDKKVNKKTWAVRFGRTFSYIEYIVFLYAPIFLLDYLTTDSAEQMVMVLILVFLAMLLTRRFGKCNGADFNKLLGLTSGYLLLYTLIASYLLVI
jgi:1,4-dihydroxy-2-naphthoate octaprenyltransferase